MLSHLFPGTVELELSVCDVYVKYVRIAKWKLLRLSFAGSVLTIFGSVVWCIAFANSQSDQRFTFEFLYIFIWIVPKLCLRNEIVRYITLYVEWKDFTRCRGDMDKANADQERRAMIKQSTIALCTVQLLHPLTLLSCIVAFIYLFIFGAHLGSVPVILCGLQLFGNGSLFVAALWR